MSAVTEKRSDLRYRLGLNLRAVVGRAYPRVVGANREPSWIFFEALLPLLGIAAYVFIYQAFGQRALAAISTASPTAPWGMCGNIACTDATQQAAFLAASLSNTNALVASVVLGGTMVAFWLNVLWSMASQLYWEKEIGNLQLYMMAPMNRMALLGGMAVGGMVMTSMRAVSTLIAGVVVFGVIFQVANVFLLLAVFFATLVALYGLGMMFASLYLLWGREAWNLSALMEEPIFFSSGFYFPLGGLFRIPGWGPAVAIAGSFIPASLGLDALRQLTLGTTAFGGKLWIFDVTTELEILVVMAVLFLILARYCLAYLETLAKREGKLTSRHQ
ncbi:MAG: ABC transporter permease [Thermoplasmata archaeon]|nr:ABC transporter permease [Thermoplasmata archaeon]